uniref:PIG-P domain-containing protein n=1 Tax=Dunaliella tertiolecta TaxID=3047 RepID=A0A7S3QQA7_DUNTE
MEPHRDGSARVIEAFGFAGWAASYVAFAWAFLPESCLHAAGITYYPSRTWAVVIPTWILVLIVFCFWLYEGLNQADVAPFASLHTVKDLRSKAFQDLGLPGVTVGHSGSGVLPLVHIEPTVVSKVLYGGMSVEEALASEPSLPAGNNGLGHKQRGQQ